LFVVIFENGAARDNGSGIALASMITVKGFNVGFGFFIYSHFAFQKLMHY